jgi:hypothetical protein
LTCFAIPLAEPLGRPIRHDEGEGSAVPLVLSICLPTAAFGIIAVAVMVGKLFWLRRLSGHGILDGRLDLSDDLGSPTDEKPTMQRLMRDRERM